MGSTDCACVSALRQKREALDGVKPSWCHFSSDRRFLSLNLSSEELRDKYRDSRLLRIRNTRDSGCMSSTCISCMNYGSTG